ncbi:MAG: PAS domain S-box protein [Hymenobacteraceae bacterium]|nr:PAS domain S-box protein [Hymenobacteraceae bacterium]
MNLHAPEFYHALANKSTELVLVTDPNGTIKFAGQSAHPLLGYQVSDLLETRSLDYIHPNDLPLSRQALQHVQQENSVQLPHFRVKKSNGEWCWLDCTVTNMLQHEQVQGMVINAKDITDIKNSKLLIKEQAAHLEHIVESITEPFFALDIAGRYTFMTRACAAFLGRDREELLGQVIWEQYPDSIGSVFYTRCHEVSRTNIAAHFEEIHVVNGEAKSLLISIYPRHDGITVQFSDNTDRRKQLKQLEKLSLVASRSTNSVIITNREARIEWVNDGFTRLTGYTLAEASGKKPGELLQKHDKNREDKLRFRKKLMAGKPFSEEVLNYKKSGEKVWIMMEITPVLNEAGEIEYFVAIQSDITEKKETEASLLKLTDELYMQNRDLEEFAYILSHNLRAPVANALGLAKLIKKVDKDTPAHAHALDKLHHSVHRLDDVIRDINQLLSVRESSRAFVPEKILLKDLCQEVLVTFEEELRRSEARVSLAMEEHCTLLSNRAYLSSILQQLISNALKYRAPDRQLHLQIKAENGPSGCTITLSDNGTGMSMQLVQHQLFKLYKRFHPGISGKGLGLFLVKTQVEALGGKVEIKSKLNIGTKVKINLSTVHV